MFGKPTWFQAATGRWGLRPVAWQGWTYGLAWIGALALPFVGLLARRQAPEALIWLVAASGLLVWDVWSIRRGLRSPSDKELLIIGDD